MFRVQDLGIGLKKDSLKMVMCLWFRMSDWFMKPYLGPT